MKNENKIPIELNELYDFAKKHNMSVRTPHDLKIVRQAMNKEIQTFQEGYKSGHQASEFFIKRNKKKATAIPRTIESLAISTMKKGYVFYTAKTAHWIIAMSLVHKVKVKTTKLFTIDSHGKTEKITRVTILL